MSRVCVLALALSLLLAGCASRYHARDLPRDPVAIVYRSFDERQKLIQEEDHEKKAQDPSHYRDMSERNELDLDRLARFLGVTSLEDVGKALRGRLMLLDPIDAKPVEVPFEARGARPLDWSPGHRRLLYLANERGQPALFEWDRDSGFTRRVSYDEGRYVGGAYGPDGALAFAKVEPMRRDANGRLTGGVRIFVRRKGSGRAVPVTPGPFDADPTWSPAGGPLVYTSQDANGTPLICAVDPSGGGAPVVLAQGRQPRMSRDGRFVVFSARTHKGWRLWRMHPDGRGRELLGPGPFEEGQPTISPDGRFVLYVGTPKDSKYNTQLMVRPLDGSADIAIKLDGDGLFPVW